MSQSRYVAPVILRAREFIRQRCVASPNGRVSESLLLAAFMRWLDDRGERYPDSRRVLFATLWHKVIGVRRERDNGVMYVRGLALPAENG